MEKPTVVVTNGTAGEGYWAVHYLLRTGRFHVRATVRSPGSPLGQTSIEGGEARRACAAAKVQSVREVEAAIERVQRDLPA